MPFLLLFILLAAGFNDSTPNFVQRVDVFGKIHVFLKNATEKNMYSHICILFVFEKLNLFLIFFFLILMNSVIKKSIFILSFYGTQFFVSLCWRNQFKMENTSKSVLENISLGQMLISALSGWYLFIE